jgi:hypothetical protein
LVAGGVEPAGTGVRGAGGDPDPDRLASIAVAVRRIVCLLILAVLTLAACGGDDGPGSDPRAQALAVLPRDTPLAAVVQTGGKPVDRALDLVRSFPGGGLALARLEQEVAQRGVDYGRDVKPLLGNPLAFGLARKSGNDAILALVVRDEKTLGRTLKAVEEKGGRKLGSYRKAQLYATSAGSTVLARRGTLVVLANSEADLRAALDREAKKTGLRASDFDTARSGLPGDALLTGVGRLDAVLRGPATAQARRVPWVAALRDYAFTAEAGHDGITVRGRVRADGKDLTDADSPIATGEATTKVARVPTPAVGLRDVSHLLEFAQRAAQTVSPSQFSDFERAKATIGAASGVDLDKEVLGQFASDATFTLADGSHVALRATARDPGRLRRALERLRGFAGRGLQGAGVSGAKVRAAGDGMWTVEQGGVTVGAYGVIGSEFVAGDVDADTLRRLAATSTAAVPDAKGAVSMRVPAPFIRSFVQAQTGLPSAIAQAVLARLGDARAWISSSRDGLDFTARLDVR